MEHSRESRAAEETGDPNLPEKRGPGVTKSHWNVVPSHDNWTLKCKPLVQASLECVCTLTPAVLNLHVHVGP